MKRLGMIDARVRASRKLSSSSSVACDQKRRTDISWLSAVLFTRTISSASDQSPLPSFGGGCVELVNCIHDHEEEQSYLYVREEEDMITRIVSPSDGRVEC